MGKLDTKFCIFFGDVMLMKVMDAVVLFGFTFFVQGFIKLL